MYVLLLILTSSCYCDVANFIKQSGCGPGAVCMGAKGNQGCNQEGLVNPSCVTSGCNQQNTINPSCVGKCSCFDGADRGNAHLYETKSYHALFPPLIFRQQM